ncbi:MAG: type IV secretory pathway VirB6-like protein [Rickettsiales bacterium]|jgi:type IV secretory pathway VirB6-like protein
MIYKILNTHISRILCRQSHNLNLLGGFKIISLASILLFGIFLSTADAAKDRLRTCTPLGGAAAPIGTELPRPEGLIYSPIDGGEDYSFDQSNPYCLATVLPLYAAVKVTIPLMNVICGTSKRRFIWYPTPLDISDLFKASFKISKPACLAAWTIANTEFRSFVLAMKIQHSLGQEVYENSSLCGGGVDNDWVSWNSVKMTRTNDNRRKIVDDFVQTWSGDSSCVKNLTIEYLDNDQSVCSVNKRKYREWYYGGVEREDVSDNPCADVTRNALPGELVAGTSTSGNSYPAQRYYLRGTDPGRYHCERFNHRINPNDPFSTTGGPLSSDRIEDYKKAYQCCVTKSNTNTCIERKFCNLGGFLSICPAGNVVTKHKFCEAGTNCTIGSDDGNIATNVSYQASYRDNKRLICASTRSFCPYDFNLGGGTTTCDYFKDGQIDANKIFQPISTEDIEKGDCGTKSEIRKSNCDIDENKANRCRNYCQYLNHCVVVSGNNFTYESDITSPYFSKACLNFVGDSKNEYAYGDASGSISVIGAQKHFTAPIAQCVRETLENVFYNIAGHSKCSTFGEFPNKEGVCFTNSYKYKEGNLVSKEPLFYKIQEYVKDLIKIVLSISIMLQGFKILLTGEVTKRKDLVIYVAKIGLVLFFATGSAWQTFFFDGVYNASSTLSTTVMNISTSSDVKHQDGCQFGKISFSDGTSEYRVKYPDGKQYLAIFDTFDCKIARYLGLGPSATVASIVLLIIPALISPAVGGIGIFFAVLTAAFGIIMIVAAIRILHVFLVSAFLILLLVYISPITIVCILFEKTKAVFNRWLNSLIGYSIQPIILFAYIGIFITIFETLVTGSATFTGTSPQKEIVCDKICVDINGNESLYDANICDEANGAEVLDPKSDSIICMMNLSNDSFKSNPVLAPFGITLTILGDFFTENGRQKILSMLKAVLVVYILAAFIDKIPAMAGNLMGVDSTPSGGMPDSLGLAKKVAGVAAFAQKRGAGAAVKAGGPAVNSLASKAKEAVRSAGSKKPPS